MPGNASANAGGGRLVACLGTPRRMARAGTPHREPGKAHRKPVTPGRPMPSVDSGTGRQSRRSILTMAPNRRARRPLSDARPGTQWPVHQDHAYSPAARQCPAMGAVPRSPGI